MKKLKLWCMVGVAAAAGIALMGCGSSSDSSSSASLRVANATLTHPSLNLLINSSVAASATLSDTVSAYTAPASGSNTLQVNDANGLTALATTVPTLTGGSHYTLLAYESAGAVKTLVLGEDVALPVAGVTTLRIYDVAPEAGALDVYITASTIACTTTNLSALAATTSFGALTGPSALSLTQGAGTYNVCVTASGSKTDIRMSMPITITGQTVATVAMTPASGGALLNGSLLIQQGAYSAVRNTNSRVRLASAVSVGAPNQVSVISSDGTVVDSGNTAPWFGFYTLVPASSSLNITVNGGSSGSVAVTGGALVAGGDVTLLVSGGPTLAGVTATLLADDNRPPTNSAATKLRLINGMSIPGTVTLTANSSPIGISIASGAASTYQSATGTSTTSGNTFSFALSSSTAGPLTLPDSSATATLSANTTYSILATGDALKPLLTNRLPQ